MSLVRLQLVRFARTSRRTRRTTAASMVPIRGFTIGTLEVGGPISGRFLRDTASWRIMLGSVSSCTFLLNIVLPWDLIEVATKLWDTCGSSSSGSCVSNFFNYFWNDLSPSYFSYELLGSRSIYNGLWILSLKRTSVHF